MHNIVFEAPVLWAQVDANMHLRHSAYADFAAQGRLSALDKLGVGVKTLEELKIGPILFREELIYFREVKLNDHVKVTCEMAKTRKDGSRWSFRQDIFRSDGVKAAQVNTDGAWIDMVKRKLCPLPENLIHMLDIMPKTHDFILEETKSEA